MPGGGFSRVPVPQETSSPEPYTLGDFCIDEYRPIKVIVIGAGFSGIAAGIRFPQKVPNVELVIYEKGARIGGTWHNNNYPGLACDVPSHSYQYTFEEKKDWSSFYASGPEIREHLQEVVDKYKLMRYIRLQHEVVHAEYDEPTGKWHVRVRRPNPETGALEEIEDTGNVLLAAFGLLSRWKWPDISGLHDFKGELLHSAGFEPGPKTWQEVAEAWKDKRVGVIGLGSSAIQIVAAIQPRVKKLENFGRGKTWLAQPFGQDLVARLLGREPGAVGDYRYTPEEIERFKNEPDFFWNFRYTLDTEFNSSYSWTIKDTPLQLQVQQECRKNMEEKLAKKPWIAEHLIPDFPVACRRLTPGPGYLEALCEDNTDFVPTPIKRVTENGIETVDGKVHELDVIICATGYDTSFQLPFKILGRGGLDINEKWKPHAVSYLSVAVDGFPNMFIPLGPNGALASGLLTPLMEAQLMYAVQATAKLQRDRLKSMDVKPEAVRDFDQYIDVRIPLFTVFSEKCRSWYKVGKEEGRVVGLWPGSTLQGIKALMHPRWEDFNYELADPVQNRLHWLGDGQTVNEKTLSGDRAWYLHAPFLDVPPTHHAPLYSIGDFCIDEYRPIKVIVIGAGFSGITAGIRFPQKVPNIELVIYEKGARIGGTWHFNNYPGLACDIPSHTYQHTFTEKKDWSSFYASGSEIREHLQEVVDKYKLMRYIRLQREVVHAEYDEPIGKWHVRVHRPNPDTGALEEIEDSADVLMSAMGLLSRWKWPDIDGLKVFKGELHHSAGFEPTPKSWEEVAESWKDKKVGVIGVGSSAIQIVPALQPKVGKLVNFSRGKTWISQSFGEDIILKLLGREPGDTNNYEFTSEEKERFKNDPEFFHNFRQAIEHEFNGTYPWTIRGSPLQIKVQQDCRKAMAEKLAKIPHIAQHLIPDFPVACRRLTPGPGYLEALCADNADLVPVPIKRVYEGGIETEDGQQHDLDVIICATGYDTSFQLPFKILGRGGLDINERWRPHAVSYLTVAVDGFPNMFMSLGPNSALASGMFTPFAEQQVMYAAQAIAKLQRDRYKSMEIKAEAVRDFDEYIEAYFPKTVFSQNCRSWYKLGKVDGPIVGLWPGSTLQGMKALQHPRWEDYNYELADSVQNRLHWLGDGQTYNEKTLTGDRAWYLRAPFLDIPPGE
ncbi:hypothetical protein C8Q77DRAFT_1054047 [Trametes polyzona]|nr:hypothetical protein C8Q77DRAFT_1054047 [Trametes polyzona]